MKHFERFESYTNGKLSASDTHAFEQELTTNADLLKEWEEYKLAKQASGALAYEQAKQRISKLNKTPLQVAHRRSPARQVLRIAAVLLVLVVSAFIFSQVRYTDQALASHHYRSASSNMRSPQSDAASQLIDAKKYDEAITMLANARATDPVSKGLLAEALSKSERYTEAINVYLDLASNPENINREGAEFSAAVLYLKSGQKYVAIDRISKIADSETHDYRFEARKLRDQMNSVWRKMVL